MIGNSELIPAGESTDVTITLSEPLTESATVFPMAHIDTDGDGVYGFNPPDNPVDGPAMTDAGEVVVVAAELTVG